MIEVAVGCLIILITIVLAPAALWLGFFLLYVVREGAEAALSFARTSIPRR